MIFDDLDIHYTEIDNYFASKEFEARAIGDALAESDNQAKRELNDQVYFLFIFTRLEKRILDLSNALFAAKLAGSSDTKDIISWTLMKKKKLDLMERVSFFLTSGHTDYNLVYDYKKKRDSVAHGSFASGINIPAILADMKRLYVAVDN